MGRRRTTLVSAVALAVATGAVVTYAVSADGYKAHEADLNDGGVWVVNGERGWSGRINKPINQLDGVVVGEEPEMRLDVVQDGAAVVVRDLGSNRGEAIDTSQLDTLDGGAAAVPTNSDVQMGGGTLASLDLDSGQLWAVRYDPRVGRPVMSEIDRQSDGLAEVGAGAALAVSLGGTIVATSSKEGTLTTVRAAGAGLAEPRETELPGAVRAPSAVTTVGERVVTLDRDTGTLAVLSTGVTAQVQVGSELQQPGPAADAVLVGTDSSLLSVDLETGAVTTVVDGASGRAVEPVRLGACVYGAWSGGRGAVKVACGSD